MDEEVVIYNYMPQKARGTDIQIANEICSDEETISDDTGLTNKDKWHYAMQTFGCEDCTLFSSISYEQIYKRDNFRECSAAACVADLRTQYLEKRLSETPHNWDYHVMYVKNIQWHVKLRERAKLEEVTKFLRTIERPQ